MIDPGSVVAGRYQVEQQAGQGGMGVVFRAIDRTTGEPVALKLLRSGDLSLAEIDRFVREAEVLAALRHPNIVAYVDHGETEDGRHFLAMEWLTGHDLGAHLERHGPLAAEDAVTLLRRLTEALAVAHARGVVHRDIKPGNIFLRDGRVDRPAVLDFGIARLVHTHRRLTQTGAMLGTPVYMAPEQVRGDSELGPAVDVFALGSVLFECLVGAPPFMGMNVVAVLAKILFHEVPSVRFARPELPRSLDALLERMLAKAPRDRLADADAVLAALGLPAQDVTPAPTVRSATSSLTTHERRILSVVLAVYPASAIGQGPTVERSGLGAILEPLGAHHVWLPDGSLAVVLAGHDSAVDQAVHAARCALLIRERLPETVVSLATGRGQLERDTLAGEVIDRAAALGRTRPPEGVWIDVLSADLLASRFRITELEGQAILLAEREDLDPTRLLLGKPTPCVGRERELAMLEAALADCFNNDAAQAVLVTAPPGVGKSRLRHELLRRVHAAGSAVEVLVGLGAQPNAGSPYGLLGQALRRLCGAHVDEPLATQRTRLRARLGLRLPAAEAPWVQDFLGELAGVPAEVEGAVLRAARAEPRLMAEQIDRAFIRFLRAECANGPVLLVLEDLQWSDALTIKLIDLALREAEELPFFVLALARPEVHDNFPRLWESRRHQQIHLPGLPRKASERLARNVLGEALPAEVLARMVAIAAGNALFLEEMIRAVAEGKGETTPDTVLAMVQARLMRLDTFARRVLRAASVFGETFRGEGVVALLGVDLVADAAAAALGVLVDAEIVERRQDAWDDHGFRHTLVRDAAYDLLTETDRTLGHRLALDYLEPLGGVEPILLAEHALAGGEPARATLHFIRAAERSFERNDLETALRHAERGLACDARGAERGVLLALQCEGHFVQGGETWTHADAAGSAALDLLPPGSLWWCRAAGRLALILPNTGQNERMRQLAARYLETRPEPGGVTAYVGALAYLLGMMASIGERAAVDAFSRRLTEIAADIDANDALAHGFIGLGHAIRYFSLDADPYQQLILSRRSVASFEQVHDLRDLMTARYLLGVAEACAGDPEAGARTLAACRATAEQLDDRFYVVQCLVWGAWTLLLRPGTDHLDEACDLASQAIAADVSPIDTATAHAILARALLARGATTEAEQHIHAALPAATAIPSVHLYTVSTLCRVLLAQGRAEAARLAAEEGLAVLNAVQGVGFCEVDFLTSAAEAQLAAGHGEAGRRTLSRALARISVRADGMPDAQQRRRYEALPENLRARSLLRSLAD